MRVRFTPLAALAGALLLAGCATGVNYTDPAGPRYAGGTGRAVPTPAALRLVSFNVEYADSIDAAIRLLTSEPALASPDVLFLQEMDSAGAARIAAALGHGFVYYPSQRRKSGKDFGNAVLTPWPIEADRKLILPYLAAFFGTQRIATAATIRIGGVPVRVYSTHLGTPNISGMRRREQLETILDDARAYDRVIVAGDMNDEDVGHLALERGYRWPTRRLPHTVLFGTWDHVFVRGIGAAATDAAGVVDYEGKISDHKPVWVTVTFPR